MGMLKVRDDPRRLEPPDEIKIPENHYRYWGKGGPVCNCDAYSFPHRPNGGKCQTCKECGFPSANCVCYLFDDDWRDGDLY